MTATACKQSNGRTVVVNLHVSKRGKVYKRVRIIKSVIDVPKWWRR